MTRTILLVGSIVIVLGVLVFLVLSLQPSGEKQVAAAGASPSNPLKIGVVSALTGDLGFFGESTRAGIKLAERDLEKEGVYARFIFEDAQTDATKAVSAAQKLVNVDGVRGIYSEFNPAAIAISSFVKGTDILHVYDAAPVSPLEDNPLVYKTYVDYEVGCANVARYLKDTGVTSVAILKAQAEFADLCAEGVWSVFGPDVPTEKYVLGDTDFRTQILKLSQSDPEVIFNVTFPAELISSLRNMQQLGLDSRMVTASDGVPPDAITQSPQLLEGLIVFGLPPASKDFIERVKHEVTDENVSFEAAAALGYIHTMQMARALSSCGSDTECIQRKMDEAAPEPIVGFGGFSGHIAKFDMPIQEFYNGRFVEIR